MICLVNLLKNQCTTHRSIQESSRIEQLEKSRVSK